MKYIVLVWDCRVDTDDTVRTRKFKSWDNAMKYVKQLPDYEGGVINLYKKESS